MVSRVVYRPFDEDDFDELAAILQKEWHADAADREYCLLEASHDLAHALSISSFSQVALIDGKPRGIILARLEAPHDTSNGRWACIGRALFARMQETSPRDAAEYRKALQLTNSKNSALLAKSNLRDASEITLLAVSGEVRGLGIGSVLMDAATTYLTAHGKRHAYLYTDTDCSWKFYESHGFERAAAYRSTLEERRLLPREMYIYGLNMNA